MLRYTGNVVLQISKRKVPFRGIPLTVKTFPSVKCTQTSWKTNRKKYRQTGRNTYVQTDTQAERQKYRHTDRHTYVQYRQTDKGQKSRKLALSHVTVGHTQIIYSHTYMYSRYSYVTYWGTHLPVSVVKLLYAPMYRIPPVQDKILQLLINCISQSCPLTLLYFKPHVLINSQLCCYEHISGNY